MKVFAQNVNTGGALVLLKELISRSEKLGLEIKVDCDALENNQRKNNLSTDEKTLYFGNLPPVRYQKDSAVYLHNYYLALSIYDLLREVFVGAASIKHLILACYIRLTQSNVDTFIVQTPHMRDALRPWVRTPIVEMPFFSSSLQYSSLEDNSLQASSLNPNTSQPNNNSQEKSVELCAVGLPSRHKNYFPLVRAIRQMYLQGYAIRLELTVPKVKQNAALLIEIENVNREFGLVLIHNNGMVDHDLVGDIYKRSRALIFVSGFESLGLPLVESVQAGLHIFAPRSEVVRDVIDDFQEFERNDTACIAQILTQWARSGFKCRRAKLNIVDRGDDLLAGKWHE